MIEYNSDTRQSPNIALPIGLLFALSARVPRQPQRDSLALGRNDPASDRDRSILCQAKFLPDSRLSLSATAHTRAGHRTIET
jgi:hypothetical protein